MSGFAQLGLDLRYSCWSETPRQEAAIIKMFALPYYFYLYDTHEVAMNKVPYINENDKRAGNFEHLNDATLSQNDEKSNGN